MGTPQDKLNDSKVEAIATRQQMMDTIADQSEQLRADDLVGYDPDERDDNQYQESLQLEEGQEKKVAEPRKFKLKVNGQEIELTEAEVIERAQKVESADRYLADKKREAEELTARAKTVPSTDAPIKAFAEDDLALARVLQMGSEEEAAQAIARIRKSTPSINVDELALKAVDRLRFEQDSRWFQEQYPEIFQQNDWRDLAILMDEKAVKSGDVRPYRDRYKDIGDRIHKLMGHNPDSLESRREAKAASAAPIKTASQRSAGAQDEDEDDTATSVIAKMAKQRGQVIG